MHSGDVAFLMVKPGDPAFVGRGDLHQRLVRHHLGDRLVLLDDISFAYQPFDQFALHDTFADIGQYKITHGCSPVLIST